MFSAVTNENGETGVSIYTDAAAGETQIATAVAKLVASYPQTFGRMNGDTLREFGLAMADAIKRSGMSGQRLQDAVTYCILHKPTFAICDITAFDRNVRLYPYAWACNKSGFVRSDLKRTDCTPWEFWWCRAQDIEKVNEIAKFTNHG